MNTRKLRKAILTLCSALLLVSLSVGITLAYLTDTSDVVENTFHVGNVAIKLDEADVYEVGETTDPEQLGKEKEGEARVIANKYKLIPNHTYDKDPTITVREYSEDCYVMAKITVNTAVTHETDDGSTQTILYDLGDLIPVIHADGEEDPGLIAFGGIVTGGVFGSEFDAPEYGAYSGDLTVNDDLVYENEYYKLIQPACHGSERHFYVFVKDPKAANDQVVLFENLVIPGDWGNEEMKYLSGLNIKVEAFAVQSEGFDEAGEGYGTAVETAIAAGFGNVFQ